jgi:DNA primase
MDKFERFHEAESKNRTCSGFAEASKRWDEIQLQKLRDLPIEGVAERLGLHVSRHKCLCPFHDDHTPSLSFKNNKFRCWSCGESGDSISLAEKMLGKGFVEACRWLADEHNVILTEYKPKEPNSSPKGGGWEGAKYSRYFEHPFLNAEARHFLFDERKLDERVVRWCRLTSWRDRQGIPWLQIPYYDQQGKLVGVQNRNLSSPPRGGVRGGLRLRFRFPRGSRCGIYNLPVLNLLKPGEDLYIAEGCSDCWALLSAGHKAIAIPSATLLTKPVLDQLLQALPPSPTGEGTGVRLHMFPDRDAPGERLFLQLKEVLPGLEHHQLPPDCKDVSDLYLKGQIQNSKLINSKL